MSEPRVLREVQANGLTLLLREAHSAPVAEIQVWARVGSADERPGEEGLAHFHEHMLFKGTERRGVGDVAGEVEGVGGHINAYTSFDVTVYHATVPSAEWSTALDVLADSTRFSVFDPDEIEREIEVVLEEIRRSEDAPGHVLSDAVFAECYRQHPYRAPILGTRESVERFDRERVSAFFRRWYTPENLVVVGVGDFDAEAVREAVRAAWADAEPGQARRTRSAEPTQDALRSMVLHRPFERARLDLSWVTASLASAETPYLDLLAFVLGEGESSRLVRRVRERDGLVERIDAWSYTPLDPGVFSVNVETDAARCEHAIGAVAREVERLRHERVSPEELAKARANFLASEHFERESVGGMARKLGGFEVLAGDHRREARYLEAIQRATPDDLLRVAQAYLAPEKLTVGALLPEADTDALDAERVATAVRGGVERTARAFGAPARARGAGDIHSYRLAGGAALHVVRRDEIPVVAVRASFLGGLLAEDEERSGLSAFLSDLWLRGTHGRSSGDLARAIETLAVDLDGFSGRNSLGVTLDATSDRLEPGLDLLAEVLLEPAFDPDELDRERRETLAAIVRREDRLGARAFQLFAQTHWQAHPYRLPVRGSAKSVEAFDVEMVRAHHARLVRAGNLVVGVTGAVDPDRVAEQLSARLADLDAGPADFTPPPVEPPPREARSAELRKDRAQAHMLLGFRGLQLDDPDRFALEVLSQLLAGQGGSLFLELRDRQGLAYSVSCMNVEGVAPGFFAVYLATAPEKLDAARTGVREQLDRLLQQPPAEGELARARRHLSGSFAIDLQRAATRAAHLSLDALYGLGPDDDRHYCASIEAVSGDDVLRVARRVLDFGCTEAVVRP